MGLYKVGRAFYFRFRFKGQHVRRSVGPVSRRLAQLAEDAERKRLRARWVAQRFGAEDQDVTDGLVPTLEAYTRETYLPTHLPTLAASSQVQARSLVNKLVRDLGAVRLDELGPPVLDRWRSTRLARDKVSLVQVTNDARFLSSIINHARRQRVVTAHPMHGWRWPKPEAARFHVISETEERALRRAAGEIYDEDLAERVPRPIDLRPWMDLALATGLRKDELRRAMPEHVDVARKELRFRQPKVKRDKIIPLERPTLQLIAKLRRPGLPLLARPDGTVATITRIDRIWKRVRTRAKLPGIRFHDLRHTFATRALEAGGSVPEVGDMLGHKPPDYKMTWRYVHAMPEGKRATIRSMLGLKSGHRRGVGRR